MPFSSSFSFMSPLRPVDSRGSFYDKWALALQFVFPSSSFPTFPDSRRRRRRQWVHSLYPIIHCRCVSLSTFSLPVRYFCEIEGDSSFVQGRRNVHGMWRGSPNGFTSLKLPWFSLYKIVYCEANELASTVPLHPGSRNIRKKKKSWIEVTRQPWSSWRGMSRIEIIRV